MADFLASLQSLIGWAESGGLMSLDTPTLLASMQEFERARNLMSLVDHAALRAAEATGLAAHLGHQRVTTVLVQALRISPEEALRRVRAAEAVGDRVSILGELLQSRRPVLAAAQRTGEVSAEHAAIIDRALHSVDRPGLDQAAVTAAEQVLSRHAVSFGPQELRKIAVHLVDRIDPDGTMPAEDLAQERRDLRLVQQRDGMFSIEGRLTAGLGTQLVTVLSPLAKRRISRAEGPNGGLIEEPDGRTHGQRMHDALEDGCARLLRAGGLPASGGTPATVIVTIDYQDLLNRTGHGESSDGTLLSAAEVLRLADEAEVLPAVLSRNGVLLELGQTCRVANQSQTYALIARDGGCSFPGCSHPPEWSDRHHVRSWVDGGPTNIKNLTLLCRYHHAHFVGHGWTCRMNERHLPEWITPVWVDPEQRPLLNARIRAKHVLAA